MNQNQSAIQKANRYLSQIRDASKELTELILRIDYLRYRASGAGAIRYDKDHVQTSPEDMMCQSISEAVDLEQQLSARSKQLKAMREHTEQVISLWSDNNARFIDIYYLNHGSMTEAADRIGCTSRSAYNIKFRALEEFAKHL